MEVERFLVQFHSVIQKIEPMLETIVRFPLIQDASIFVAILVLSNDIIITAG